VNPPARALLLVGSPKRSGSASETMGAYLMSRLAARGVHVDSLHLSRAVRSTESRADLFAAMDAADLIVLAAPLYVDSLPAPVIKVLELVAEHRATGTPPEARRFAAIVNSGFPEPAQNDTALAICRQFAREAGFTWAGGLGIGGGGLVVGKPLERPPGLIRRAVRALDLAADALADGRPIPDAACEAVARPLVWPWLYRLVGNFGFRREAGKHGARIGARPDQR
jgi:hypothetical protein